MSPVDEIRKRQENRFGVDHLTKIKLWHGDPVIGTLVSNLCKAYENDGKDIMDLLSEVERMEIEIKDRAYEYIITFRGIETACKKCSGLGVRTYGSTGTWRSGCGGQMLTTDVCDACWGSGDENRKWADLRKVEALREENKRLREALSEAASQKYPWCQQCVRNIRC